ncbi:hypothetical protein BJ969_004350 [Saccharopolyspora gloriosae]|uniref:Uncharacterized protein n=1 Tax=Saccharopolyspora gloriosae TaxID=455344 RepID=A0A840NQ57_9PSEU|nr:hypothetical protein [Saccharopolyspora gloriosae]MBB5071262.1 hypothetical protein [Saccharopolyspora gloriosae]
MSGMHSGTGVAGVDAAGLLLRVLLLGGTAVAAGLGLLRPTVRVTGRATTWTAWAAAAAGAAASLLSIPVLDVNGTVAVLHAVLLLALPIALRWPTPAAYLGFALTVLVVVESALGHSPAEFFVTTVVTAAVVTWFGLTGIGLTVPAEHRSGGALRPGPLALALAAVLVVAAAVQLVLTGIADRRLLTGFGAVLLLIVAAALVVAVLAVLLRRGDPWRIYRYGAAAVAVAFVAWTVLPGIPKPGELPQPGVPRLAHATVADQDVPVLITPHRPGRNLVHLPESVTDDITVEAGGTPVRAQPRPGTSGTWAEVDLPAGRSDVELRRTGGDEQGSVEVDTGDGPAVPGSTGPDGPECASVALAGLVAGQRAPLESCPAEALADDDAEALRELVGYIHRNGAPGITVLGDDSPRSRHAADVVREAAAQAGLPTGDAPHPDRALILVGGWTQAAEHLDSIAASQNEAPLHLYGVHLAPWLMHSPVTTTTASSAAPLRFDPRDYRSLEYGMALSEAFGGEPPSVAGFDTWLAARGQVIDDPVVVYASAKVDAMQMNMPGMSGGMHGSEPAGQWVPRGTVVAVSGPLTP